MKDSHFLKPALAIFAFCTGMIFILTSIYPPNQKASTISEHACYERQGLSNTIYRFIPELMFSDEMVWRRALEVSAVLPEFRRIPCPKVIN